MGFIDGVVLKLSSFGLSVDKTKYKYHLGQVR